MLIQIDYAVFNDMFLQMQSGMDDDFARVIDSFKVRGAPLQAIRSIAVTPACLR